MSQIRIFALSFICFILSFPVYAESDFTESWYSGYRNNLEKFVSGTNSLGEEAKHRFCKTRVPVYFLGAEVGKLLYNDDFGEIKSDEHARDIRQLKKEILGTDDCIERFRLWLAYDDKWYKAEREEKIAARAELEAQWKAQIVDTGPENWDGVINGTFFSIPRKFIWFGRSKPDGIEQGINLQFFYPYMEAYPSSDPEHKDKKRNIGVLLHEQKTVHRPCVGYEDVETCPDNVYVRYFWSYLKWPYTYKKNSELGEFHYSYWRGMFSPKTDPIFDEEAQMWVIMPDSDRPGFYTGNPAFPDDYLKCRKPPIPEDKFGGYSCESTLHLSDNLYLKYSFPRELFFKHKEIQSLLRAKIQSFIVDPAAMQGAHQSQGEK